MSDVGHPPQPTIDRGRIVLILGLLANLILLLGIVFLLLSIGRNGLSIHLGGDVDLSDVSDHLIVELKTDEPLILAMPQPVELTATGPGGDAVPATLSFVICPTCSQSMLPTRWNPWTGQIVWTCATCEPLAPAEVP